MKNIKYTRNWMIGMMLLPIMVLSTAPAAGQDALEASAGADIVSKYVWRGVDQGAGASIQPSLGIGYKGFSFGAWGSVPFANPAIFVEPFIPYELDFSLGYSTGGFSIGITDYYWNGNAGSYFDYYADNHLFEGNLAFKFSEKFPLTLSWNTFFAGTMDRDEDDKQQYSTYIEAAYDFSVGGLDFTASVGAVPWGALTWLNDRKDFQISAISLLGSKTLEITPTFSVPLFVQCVFSPVTDASHLVIGFSF